MKDAGGDNHAFQASNFKCKDKSRSYSYHLRPTCGWKLAEIHWNNVLYFLFLHSFVKLGKRMQLL